MLEVLVFWIITGGYCNYESARAGVYLRNTLERLDAAITDSPAPKRLVCFLGLESTAIAVFGERGRSFRETVSSGMGRRP